MLPEADAVDRCTFRPMTKPLLPFPAAKPDKASTSAPHAVAPTFLPLLSQGLGLSHTFSISLSLSLIHNFYISSSLSNCSSSFSLTMCLSLPRPIAAVSFLPCIICLQIFDEFEIGGDGCSSERSKNSENEFKTLPNGLKYYDLKTRDGLEAVKGSRVIV
ncbi:uncharacterized protein LOC130985719 isoform X1 [Salvia miltiorrhiza]|uniref:uncharacterized protein LOC130985719 isoform X1 n=1 Tax=Salvia miltiorrhiza TaxID=226208 RepID=UPI0025AC5C55|nr:uncharacterized protein LOC130985719 isoform X1 [Salvia miltiorrhiza]